MNEPCLTDGTLDPKKVNPIIMMGSAYYDLGQVVGNAFKEGIAYKQAQDI
ncbi:hypothetical protein [Sporomusa sp.]|nr:hypothetical protein [Sporomusa sp.]HWR42218.1 hypothetical protein [Sporomusa sp.]